MTLARSTPSRRARLLLLALAGVAASACRAPELPRAVELHGPTMGTTWSVTLVPGADGLDPADVQAIDGQVRDLLAHVERLMSTWDPTSELSRFNRFRGGEPFPVSPDTFAVFRAAVELGSETGGALDVTVLPLVHAWGFGARGDEVTHAPDEVALARLRAAVGIQYLELDPDGKWVRKQRPDVECDFSSLAPGYAADRIAEMLAVRDLAGFMIDVGGELVARGRNAEGAPWRVGVERPAERRGGMASVVPIADLAIATSGDYRSYREVNGVRISHIIDPRTGRPVRHTLASVTVVDPSCMRADALATALMVLGPEDGLALARRLDLSALLLVRNAQGGFDAHATRRFDALTRMS